MFTKHRKSPRTEQLVADIRLGRVVRLGRVPHILRAVERAERQAVQEVARVQQARHRPDLPPSMPPAHMPSRLHRRAEWLSPACCGLFQGQMRHHSTLCCRVILEGLRKRKWV